MRIITADTQSEAMGIMFKAMKIGRSAKIYKIRSGKYKVHINAKKL